MQAVNEAFTTIASTLQNWSEGGFSELRFSAPILSDNCGGMQFKKRSEGGAEAPLPFDWEGVDRINSACVFVRDHLLQTTGQRIWGLTFTLYPDGKFNVEYDYNKPAHYEEDDDEAATTNEAAPVANLLGGLLGDAVHGLPEDQTPETQRLSAALSWLQSKTAEHGATWGLGSEANWNLDMNDGWLRWTFADGRVMQAAVQVVGTYNTKTSSFMWGWDHPSVPEPLRRAAQQVQTLGQELGIERWTTRTVNCTEDDAWQFTALAAQRDSAAGAYRGDANGTWVYMSIGEPRLFRDEPR